MEVEYEAVAIEVSLMCEECKIPMNEYNPYIYYTYQYYYECPKCKKEVSSKKKYPYIKHIRKN